MRRGQHWAGDEKSERTTDQRLALAVMLVIVVATSLFWCVRKSGWFLDEVYTYGLSNSHYAPFVRNLKSDNMVDTIFAREELTDYLSVQENERFDIGSVWYNQQQDVHPPLYYLLVNFCSSLFPESYSKWLVLAPNLLIQLLTACVLFRLLLDLTDRVETSAFATLLYAVSTTGIETVIYARMYVLLTLLTVVLALNLSRLLDNWSLWRVLGIAALITLGMLTQYYFVFYAFFSCLACLLVLLVRREYRHALTFCMLGISGVALFVIIWPAVISHVLTGQAGGPSGTGVLGSLLAFGNYPRKLLVYAYYILKGMPVGSVLWALSLAGLPILVHLRKRRSSDDVRVPLSKLFVVVVPAFVTLVVAAVASPYEHLRYAYNVCPLFFVALGTHLSLLEGTASKRSLRVGFVAACMLTLLGSAVWQPEYLYPQQATYEAELAPYREDPCIFLDDNHIVPLTQELPRLLCFDEVFVTDDPTSRQLADYIEQNDSKDVVVYVSLFGEHDSYDVGTAAEVMAEALGYDEVTPLYTYEHVKTYLLHEGD